MSRAPGPAAAHPCRRGEPHAGPDGRYTALHGAPAVSSGEDRRLPLPGAPARNSSATGWAWSGGRFDKGAAELARPSPRPIAPEFSKRRHEMLRAAERRRRSAWTRRRRAEAAALATRERKQYGIDTHTWREEVRARAAELGLGRDESRRAAPGWSERRRAAPDQTGRPERRAGRPARGAAGSDRAREHVRRARRAAGVRGAAGQGARSTRCARRPNGSRSAPTCSRPSGRFTTAELVECERRLIDAARRPRRGRRRRARSACG